MQSETGPMQQLLDETTANDPQGTRRGAVDLGPFANNVGFHLRLASVAMEHARKAMTGTDLPLGHFPVLFIIRLNPDATQSAIAKAVGLQRSSLVPVLKKLEQSGWIERQGDVDDRRANRVTLTAKGEEACDALMAEVDSVEAMTRAKLGARRYERLVELLRNLHEVMGE